jgi:hypothetical protein
VRLRDVPKGELRRKATFKEPGRIGSDIIRLNVFQRDLSLEDRRTVANELQTDAQLVGVSPLTRESAAWTPI